MVEYKKVNLQLTNSQLKKINCKINNGNTLVLFCIVFMNCI